MEWNLSDMGEMIRCEQIRNQRAKNKIKRFFDEESTNAEKFE